MFANLDGAGTLDDLSVLSLIENGYADWAADFSTITDSKTNPASDSDFDCEADFHFNCTYTEEVDKTVSFSFRRTNDDNRLYILKFGVDNNVYLAQQNDGSGTTIGSYSAAADTTPIQWDLVVEGSVVKLYENNVLKVSGTTDINLTTADGTYISHNLASNDISLTTHPYPALGIATDRVIAPQNNGTYTHTDDFLAAIREIHVSAAGTDWWDFRIIDGSNYIRILVTDAGALNVWEYWASGPSFHITAGNGTVSENDDVVFICDGASASIFVNGTQAGSTVTLNAVTSGTAGKAEQLQDTTGANSIELWPRDVSSILPSELT